MHSYLKAVGFSEIKKRAEMKEILLDVIRNYDEKNVVSDHPDGTFAEFSKKLWIRLRNYCLRSVR